MCFLYCLTIVRYRYYFYYGMVTMFDCCTARVRGSSVANVVWRPPASLQDIARLEAQLSRDPSNPKFPNQAIKVSVYDPSKDADEELIDFIGYLEHDLAAALAPLIDANHIGLRCIQGTCIFLKFSSNSESKSKTRFKCNHMLYRSTLGYIQCFEVGRMANGRGDRRRRTP